MRYNPAMKKRIIHTPSRIPLVKTKWDQFAIDIEFLLISVIQGVALATLATVAVAPIASGNVYAWPYLATGFVLILIFWTGAITHALSFITWPLDLVHTYLYFLASFIEVLVLYQAEYPLRWFIGMMIFQIIAAVLYWYDLTLMRKRKKALLEDEEKRHWYSGMISQHKKELTLFVPVSFLFNLSAVLSLFFFPTVLAGKFHLMFIALQFFFGLHFLFQETKSFSRRFPSGFHRS